MTANQNFLRANGYLLPVIPGSAVETPTHVGELGESRTNRPQRRRRGIPRKWGFTTKPLGPLSSDMVEGLLHGQAYHWPFDFDPFSKVSGLGPEVGGVYSLIQNDGLSKFGYGYLDVGGGSIVFDVRTRSTAVTGSGKLTVSYWRASVAGTWEHVTIRTRDGAKWLNGVRADATVTTELTVGAGGIALAESAGIRFFDDLVVMLWDVDDVYPVSFYDWTTDFGLEAWWKMDALPPVEELSGAVGFFIGTPTIETGITGNAIGLLSASLEYLDVPNSTLAWMTGSSMFSFSLWVKLLLPEQQADLISVYNAAGVDLFRVRFSATSQVEVVLQETVAVASEIFTTSDRFVADGSWTHVVASVDLANNNVDIIVNGSKRSTSRTGRVLNGTMTHAIIDIEIGRDAPAGASYLSGSIDEYRGHSRLLTEQAANEIYRRGLLGFDPLPPTPASDFPRLIVDGAIVETERVVVNPSVMNQPYTLFGTSAGFENAGRVVSGELQEVSSRERKRVPQPFFMALLKESDVVGGVITSVVGDIAGTINGGTTGFGALGPYRKNEAADFGVSPASIVYGAALAQQFIAAEAASIAAWIKYTVTGVSQMILHVSRASTTATKVHLELTTSGFAAFAWDEGSSAGSIASAAVIPADGEFHLVTGTINLRTKIARILVDGVVSAEAVKVVSSMTFDEVVTGARIGQRDSGVQQMNGHIAACYCYRKEISKGEHLRMFELGKKGILR